MDCVGIECDGTVGQTETQHAVCTRMLVTEAIEQRGARWQPPAAIGIAGLRGSDVDLDLLQIRWQLLARRLAAGKPIAIERHALGLAPGEKLRKGSDDARPTEDGEPIDRIVP